MFEALTFHAVYFPISVPTVGPQKHQLPAARDWRDAKLRRLYRLPCQIKTVTEGAEAGTMRWLAAAHLVA